MKSNTENPTNRGSVGTQIRASGSLESGIEVFHANAGGLHGLCDRLESVIARLVGPEPVETFGEPIPGKPCGILGQLREHGENGRQALDRLERLVNRLDELI